VLTVTPDMSMGFRGLMDSVALMIAVTTVDDLEGLWHLH
jgi:hypothetical protein